MKVGVRVLATICLLALGDMAYAEGGCPQGQTPRLYGSVWGCAPGGTDGPGAPGSGYQYYGYTPPPPVDDGWMDTYGAVAFGNRPGQGPSYWFAGAGRSWEDASAQALAACNREGGEGCVVGERVLNGFLGVAISDDGSLFAAYSAQEDGIDTAAVGKCRFEGHREGCRLLKTQGYLRRRK